MVSFLHGLLNKSGNVLPIWMRVHACKSIVAYATLRTQPRSRLHKLQGAMTRAEKKIESGCSAHE